MKLLEIVEQDVIFGGGGVSSALQGAAGSAVMSGSGSPGCAALGSLVSAGISASPVFGAVFVGTVTGVAVTNACNNRPGYPAGSRSESGMPSNANRYWPSTEHWRGGGGGGINKWYMDALSQF
ncbi:hypothetical protein [Shewanella fidelis]|uniref:hypothetical protein n=1 Tax=Shewanella fidelis TaxID=173509 RepID=UPI00048D74B6|nr:hypothetical protein [Shewanella fidelis]